MSSNRLRSRLLALGLGSLLALLVLWVYARNKPPEHRPAVDFVRSSSPLTDLFPQRAACLAAWERSMAGKQRPHLPRFPIPENAVRRIFPVDVPEQVFDPDAYFRKEAHIDFKVEWAQHPQRGWRMRTNSLGMREDSEPSPTQPDLRILVTGDSHTEGVCNNSESFANVLEAELARAHPGRKIEALNAGKGSYSFYNYLGTLEKYLALKPDVFIVAVYGPNDFEEVLTPYHYFKGTERPPGSTEYWPQIQKALDLCPTWLAQDAMSLKYFQHNPGEVEEALSAARQSALDIRDTCAAHGIRLIYVYLPGKFDTEGFRNMYVPVQATVDRLYEMLELTPKDVALHKQMADRLVAFLEEHEIETLDAREVFAGHTEPLYWMDDHHINTTAHRLIGEALVPLVRQASGDRLR